MTLYLYFCLFTIEDKVDTVWVRGRYGTQRRARKNVRVEKVDEMIAV